MQTYFVTKDGTRHKLPPFGIAEYGILAKGKYYDVGNAYDAFLLKNGYKSLHDFSQMQIEEGHIEVFNDGIPFDLVENKLKQRFPSPWDDSLSMMQGSGNDNLEIWYHHQFVQNESLSFHKCAMWETEYRTEFTPILQSSMTGTVYYNGEAVQTFILFGGENPYGEAATVGVPTVAL